MSRVIPIALAAMDAAGTATIVYALRVERSDGVVIGIVSGDQPILVTGLAYLPGLELSDLVTSSGLAVDNMDLTVLADDDKVLARDLETGRWNNAKFTLFRCNVRSPANTVDVLKRGTTGISTVNRTSYTLEFRGLGQALQQALGGVVNKTCRARLADFPHPVPGAVCGVVAADFTVTGTIDAAVSAYECSDAARTEDDDWFGDGVLTFTSGINAGRSAKVKSFADGVFTFSLPFPDVPSIGDAYSAIAGCRLRLAEDCRDKFDNVLNFQGEPHLPGPDALSTTPTPNV